MKKFIKGVLGLSLLISLEGFATEIIDPDITTNQVVEIKKIVEVQAELVDEIDPRIAVEEYVQLGSEIALDAGASRLVSQSAYGRPLYSWDLGDGSRAKFGEKLNYKFETPGKYTIKLNVKQGRKKVSVEKEVLVYKEKALVVTTQEDAHTEIESMAAADGIWLKKIKIKSGETGFSAEQELIKIFQENIDFISESKKIVFEDPSILGIQSFSQFWKNMSEEKKIDLSEKLIVKIESQSLQKMTKLIQPIFDVLGVKYILLTRDEALSVLFKDYETQSFLSTLEHRGVEYLIVDDGTRSPKWLPFSNLTTHFVTSGVSQNVIYLLLSVPFITFIIAFFRQFVGISTFGVFTPLMLTLSILVLGLKFGLAVFLVVLFVSYIIRNIFEKVELLYIPKIALLLSFLSLSFFLILSIAVYFDSSLNLALTIFPMMVMSTISEKFLSAQSSDGFKIALISTLETVFVALIAYALVDWDLIKSSVLAFPELVLLPILGNFWLGKFTGLRMSEYFKFRSLLGDDSQE